MTEITYSTCNAYKTVTWYKGMSLGDIKDLGGNFGW